MCHVKQNWLWSCRNWRYFRISCWYSCGPFLYFFYGWVNCEQSLFFDLLSVRTQNKWASMLQATSSLSIGIQAKRETAIVHTTVWMLIWQVTSDSMTPPLGPFFNITLWFLSFYESWLNLCLVRCDEWFDRLPLKPELWQFKNFHTASFSSTLKSP